VGGRLAKSLLVSAGLSLALAPAALGKTHALRFKITAVKGQQTSAWHDSISFGDCGSVTRTGSHTIAFKSAKAAKLKLLPLPLYTKSGKRRGHTYVGFGFPRTKWTHTRSFQQSPRPPGCPPEPGGLQPPPPDCGTQGPFAVPITVGWRDRKVELDGRTDPERPQGPRYENCPYDGSHGVDLLFARGRLSQKRLTHGHTLKVRVKDKETLPIENGGSQTTSLKATVTLKRAR
jgi:hypothetical protein